MEERRHTECPLDGPLLSRTFETWKEEFKAILESHYHEIENRLDKIELEIEKKSDKENVDIQIRSLHEELRRQREDIQRLYNSVTRKIGVETMWKIIGLVMTVGGAVGGLIAFVFHAVGGNK